MDCTKTQFGTKIVLASLFVGTLSAFNTGAFATTNLGTIETSYPIVNQNQITVKGLVTDSHGEPVTGVTVVVKGTTNGTVTDLEGKYSLNVPAGSILSFSYIGMKSQEIKANKPTINVIMQDDAIGLEEVVAIGYGYVKKKDLTGAVSSVSAEDMVLGGTVSNAAQALQGKSAGVQVSQTSKAPGGSISVRVRGSNSISSTNEPL